VLPKIFQTFFISIAESIRSVRKFNNFLKKYTRQQIWLPGKI